MQWYIYLITIPAAALLAQLAVELVSRPIQKMVRLRRTALERIRSFRNISLPKPRELAISSREIREYDQAVRNVRAARHVFRDLGAQLLAFSESEPTIRTVVAMFGMNIALAGHKLIIISEIYASANTDSDELRREIEQAFRATRTALAASRPPSRDALIRIRLEPICLRDVGYPPGRNRSLGQPRVVFRHTRRQALSPRRLRQPIPEPIASAS